MIGIINFTKSTYEKRERTGEIIILMDINDKI